MCFVAHQDEMVVVIGGVACSDMTYEKHAAARFSDVMSM